MSSESEKLRVDRLTLDTNLPRALWDKRGGQRVVEELLDLSDRGRVELAVTAYVRDDIPHEPLRSRINELPLLGVDVDQSRVAVLGEWVLGRDFLGSQEFEDFRLAKLEARHAREPRLPGATDWMHLHSHLALGGDVFLTWDRAILRLAPELEAELGLRAMSPENYLTTRG